MIKRIFDLGVSGVAFLLLLPLMLIAALLVWRNFGRPVFFRQIRPGLQAKPFEMVKFRSMQNAVDAKGKVLPDEERLTRFGRLLRSSSIDELPELWNVLKGDMSLVGPRPLLMEYLPHYTPTQAKRHAVRPGITGWAQVNGRNTITWDEKFELDRWYVENQTLALDIKILWLTVLQVLARRGVSPKHAATPEKFSDYMEAKNKHG